MTDPPVSRTTESLCECGYSHRDYCGGELCDVCEACGRLDICDECVAEENERDREREAILAEEDRMLYGI